MKKLQSAIKRQTGWRSGALTLLALALLVGGAASPARAQIATATVQKVCPVGCQPIQLVRANSFKKGDDGVEIQITWDLAALPPEIRTTGFEVIAKAQASNGREREERIRVGGSDRKATLVLSNFAFSGLKTFRARVVGTFSVTQVNRQFTVTSKTLGQSGRDVFLDLKWDVGSFNPHPCLFSGFKVEGAAVTDRGLKVSGADLLTSPNARSHRVQLDQGRDGINPTFVSTSATVSTSSAGAFGIECGLSSGETTVNNSIANTTLSRADITGLLDRETRLISASANGAQVFVSLQLSKSTLAPLQSAGLSAVPVFKNGTVGGQADLASVSVNPSQQTTSLSFSPANLAGTAATGPAVGFDVVLSARYLPPDGTPITFERRLRISGGLVPAPTADAGGANKKPDIPTVTAQPAPSGKNAPAATPSANSPAKASSGASAAKPASAVSKTAAPDATSKQSAASESRKEKTPPKPAGKTKS
ncbi:MAG: hypothetical protein SF339_05280 [Blastocatellia bacterium]|nr:hypothetical protein [Blastocatellia bacterium]